MWRHKIRNLACHGLCWHRKAHLLLRGQRVEQALYPVCQVVSRRKLLCLLAQSAGPRLLSLDRCGRYLLDRNRRSHGRDLRNAPAVKWLPCSDTNWRRPYTKHLGTWQNKGQFFPKK